MKVAKSNFQPILTGANMNESKDTVKKLQDEPVIFRTMEEQSYIHVLPQIA